MGSPAARRMDDYDVLKWSAKAPHLLAHGGVVIYQLVIYQSMYKKRGNNLLFG